MSAWETKYVAAFFGINIMPNLGIEPGTVIDLSYNFCLRFDDLI